MPLYYNYIHVDPRKPGKFCFKDFCLLYEPFYVGKGTNRRAYMKKDRNAYHRNKIAFLEKLGFKLKDACIIFNKTDDPNQAYITEIEYILLIGRKNLNQGPLLNLTNGGESGLMGRIISKETRKKISDSNIGRKDSEESKKLKSRAHIGLKRSSEECLAISNGLKNHPVSEETRKKISNTRKERNIKPSRKQIKKMIGSLSKVWIITDPKGNQFEIKNLASFCRKRGLFQSNLYAVASGNQSNHKGYRCSKKTS